LKDAGEEAVDPFFLQFPIHGAIADFDADGAEDVGVDVGNGEAPFAHVDVLRGGVENFRVYEDEKVSLRRIFGSLAATAGAVDLGDVCDEDAAEVADLVGGEAEA